MGSASATELEDALRRRLEPLLAMYPAAIAEVRALRDPELKALEDRLVEACAYVASVVAQLQLHRPLPLE
jgi:hypothetical protein